MPQMHDSDTGGTVVTTFPPLVEPMGSATSIISPDRDLLDLRGRVAIVTGAKYVMPGIGAVLFCADQFDIVWY
jgi:hypothetical protein